MKRIALLLLVFASDLFAQNSITIHIGTQTTSFILPVNVISLRCLNPDGSTPTTPSIILLAGQSSSCTVTVDLPAPAGGYSITPYTADPPLVLNPTGLLVAAGATTATFTVTRPASAPAVTGTGGLAGAR